MRRGRDSNGQSTEWITAQVCLLFRWPQLFPWTSSRRGPALDVEDTMRCSSQRPSCTSSPRTPRATRSSLRSTRTSNPRARPPSNNEHAPLRKEYCRRESTKCHRQALQQRQGAGLNTSKRKRQGARTARQATAVPPPVAPARGARSPRRAARTLSTVSRRTIKYLKKPINVFLRFDTDEFSKFLSSFTLIFAPRV